MVQPFQDHAVRSQRMTIGDHVTEMQWNLRLLLLSESTIFLASEVRSKLSGLYDIDQTCALRPRMTWRLLREQRRVAEEEEGWLRVVIDSRTANMGLAVRLN